MQKMKIYWIKGNQPISFNRPHVWLVLGMRGAGKSAFLERLGEYHLQNGNCILDLFAARSGENLAWLRSPWREEKRILLLSAENAIVEPPDSVFVKPYAALSLEDFENFDIIINSCILYPNIDSEFHAVNRIIDKLWQRRKWNRLVFVICREAANLMYSRMKVAETQTLAKSFLAYWLRESRHSGCSLGVDSQRFMALDIDIRNLTDFLILKAQGALGLPRDMHFIYRYFKPEWLQHMQPNEFAVLSRQGCIGLGAFTCPEWHAREGEDVAGKVGLKVKFEERPEEGEYRGRFTTVGDEEHAEICRLYSEGLSMHKIASQTGRSTKTILDHINRHDASVDKLGYCPACRRAKSPVEAVKLKQ